MLTEIREALAAELNLKMPDVAWFPYVTSVAPPFGFIYPGGFGDEVIEYDYTFDRGMDEWSFLVQARVATVGVVEQQQNLDAMIEPFGELSVKTAIEGVDRTDPNYRTLGGLVRSCLVVSCSGYRRYEVEGRGPVLGAEWQVDVVAKGKP